MPTDLRTQSATAHAHGQRASYKVGKVALKRIECVYHLIQPSGSVQF